MTDTTRPAKLMVDAEAWVKTFQAALDKVVAATMTLHENSDRDADGKVVDPYQRGYIDGVSEMTAGMGGVLSNMNDVIRRKKGGQ